MNPDDYDLGQIFEEFAESLDKFFKVQYLFEACCLVCENCANLDKNPHVDKTRTTHWEINSNGVRHMVPCKAKKIYAVMEKE